MKIITPGHKYELANFEPNAPRNRLDDALPIQAFKLLGEIETLPPSHEVTNISVLATELLHSIQDHVYGNQTVQFIEKTTDAGDSTRLVTVNNGTTNEDLLLVLIDRLQFLSAKFPCRENALAITKLEEALMWLNKRTADRMARGVEGQHKA